MQDSDQISREALSAKYHGIAVLAAGDLEQRGRGSLPLTEDEWKLLETICRTTATFALRLNATRTADGRDSSLPTLVSSQR